MTQVKRREFADLLFNARGRIPQGEFAAKFGMKQSQYGKMERTSGPGLTFDTLVEMLDAVGYDVVFEKRDDSKLGRPADPNRKIKYTMANPPPGKKGLRIGGSLGFIWDDSKMHEWEEAERRVPEMPAPWPPGHPNWKPA